MERVCTIFDCCCKSKKPLDILKNLFSQNPSESSSPRANLYSIQLEKNENKLDLKDKSSVSFLYATKIRKTFIIKAHPGKELMALSPNQVGTVKATQNPATKKI